MFVVTLPSSASLRPLEFSQIAKKSGADILEVRGDLTPGVKFFDSALPILASPRGQDQNLAVRVKATYIDLEVGEKASFLPNCQRISSYHNYQTTPTLLELEKVLENMQLSQPHFYKIATFIDSYKALVRLLELQKKYQYSAQHTIIGMGWRGHLSRLRSPTYGPFTYTCLEDFQKAAPGQIEIATYLRLPKKPQATYALVGGEQIEKSLSPLIHQTLFNAHQLPYFYTLLPITKQEEFPSLSELEAIGIQGISITAPWKKIAAQKADMIDLQAKEIGTINTLIKKDSQWTGYNTDVIGLQRGYQIAPQGSINIVGTGGVVPAIFEAWRNTVHNWKIFGRNQITAKALSEKYHCLYYNLDELQKFPSQTLIWAASGDSPIMLPPPASPQSLAIDLRYGCDTLFLEVAKKLGYHIQNGLPLLVHQALAQYQLFTGNTITPHDSSLLHQILPSLYGQ